MAVAALTHGSAGETVNESARELPVTCQADVVVGGGAGGVAAAVAAAESGAKVFLAAERPYLGDEMTATLRLWPQPGDELDAPLARRLFADPQSKPAEARQPPRPLYVKQMLDEALLAAGVPYLYSCFPTDVLRDGQGRPCGVVLANRAGRQAVIAKVIIDATSRAVVARMAGAKFRPFPAGPQTLKFVVIGGQRNEGPGLTARLASAPFHGAFPNAAITSSGDFQVIEYTAQIDVAGDTEAAWAAAEQRVRSLTYDPEQQFTADALWQVPPDSMHGRQAEAGPWRGAQQVPLDALRPNDVAGLYVLGACADLSRAAAEHLLQPGALCTLGTRVGKAAAQEAAGRPAVAGACLPGAPAPQPAGAGEVREFLAGVRPAHTYPTVPQAARPLPILGRYDVVVVGGGTCGAPSAIASARQGAKTLVIEQHHGLGGLGTLGTVAFYFWGNRCGFNTTTPAPDSKWIIEQKMHWWREELQKAGGELWFGCIGCGAFVEHGRVRGVVVATPRGRGLVLAKAVVDTTGNADIAAAAGADCLYTDERDFAVMGAGVPPRNLGANHGGADFCIVDETDIVDVWQLSVYAKDKHAHAFDQGPIIDSRERRRIVGDHTLTILDELNERTYPDTIAVAHSPFDLGVAQCSTIDPALLAVGTHGKPYVNIPYRCCLPKGVDGVLVAALGVSAEHDALPMIRMQADLENLGYAVGVAAAMAARSDAPARQIDMRALQRHLVEVKNVPERVLTDEDSYPLRAEIVAEAVNSLKADFKGASVILAQPEQSLPLLREAYAHREGTARLTCARLLGILGDPLGLDALMAAVRDIPQWDKGWNYRVGYSEDRPLLSQLDRDVITLGRAGDRRAVPVIVEKVQQLTADDDFSHHRAAALALEMLADPAAAQPLAELLAKPRISGHACATITEVRQRERAAGANPALTRREALRELLLARSLYRCGDYNGVGEDTLRRYVEDLRGHLSRHARNVLTAVANMKAPVRIGPVATTSADHPAPRGGAGLRVKGNEHEDETGPRLPPGARGGAALAPAAPSQSGRADEGGKFLVADGTALRERNGDAVRLRGVNLGGWLKWEAWMCPIDTSKTLRDGNPGHNGYDVEVRRLLAKRFGPARAAELVAAYEDAWITAEDLDRVKALGMNVVRLPFAYATLMNEDGTWRADAFERLDWAVREAWRRGLYTILDYHAFLPPGADHDGSAEGYFNNAAQKAETVRVWTRVAAHYRGTPAIALYDLLNEPNNSAPKGKQAPQVQVVCELYDEVYRAIRSVDPEHLVAMEGLWDWKTLRDPRACGYTNVVYSFHWYNWGGKTTEERNRATDRDLQAVREMQQAWNVPVFVGEFNLFGDKEAWKYALRAYDKARLNWTLWTLKNTASGDNSWGVYTTLPGKAPPVPNLATDSADTIQTKWRGWRTSDEYFALNPLFAPLLIPASGSLVPRPGKSDSRGAAQAHAAWPFKATPPAGADGYLE